MIVVTCSITKLRIFSALAVVAAAAAAAPTGATAAPPVRTVLFLDDAVIETAVGVKRVTSGPVKQATPIIDGASDHNFTPYVSVIRDGDRFRLWYDAISSETGERYFGYRESRDGLTWPGVSSRSTPPIEMRYGVSIAADGGGGLVAAWTGWRGTFFARSTDGLSWRPVTDQPGLAGIAGDIISLVRHRGRWLLFYKQALPAVPRMVAVSSSVDLVNWSNPKTLFAPDAGDGADTQFYGMGGIVDRGGLLVGFLRVLRDDSSGTGYGYTVLAWSRDGVTWSRDRQPFLDRSPRPGWDHAMAWADAQVTVGGKTLIYYGGYEDGHKDDPYTSRRIGVATMPRDRYVYRSGGVLTTVPLATRFVSLNMAGVITAKIGTASCRAAGDGVAVRLVCDRRPPVRSPIRLDLSRGRIWSLTVRE